MGPRIFLRAMPCTHLSWTHTHVNVERTTTTNNSNNDDIDEDEDNDNDNGDLVVAGKPCIGVRAAGR